MKIMYIDDEPGIREQAKIFLEDIYGLLDVKTFESGAEALDELEHSYYSAVISDYRMPDMDGIELLRLLRERGDDTPFIIFTGKGREEVAMKALNLGADGYIQKGDDPRTQYILMAQTIKQIVEKHQADIALKRSERDKSMILDSLSEQVIHIDESGTVIWANRSATKAVGMEPGSIVGKKCYRVWFEREKFCQTCPMPISAEYDKKAGTILSSSDGKVWYIRTEPMISDDGRLQGFLEIKDDVTERENAMKAYMESEKKFHTMVETAPSAVMILNSEKLLYFNRATEHITGYSRDQLKNMNITDMVSEEQKDLVKDRLDELQEGSHKVPTRYEVEICQKGGDKKWLYISCGRLIFESEPCVLMIAMDITDRKDIDEMFKKVFP